jgi:hypothetical protein
MLPGTAPNSFPTWEGLGGEVSQQQPAVRLTQQHPFRSIVTARLRPEGVARARSGTARKLPQIAVAAMTVECRRWREIAMTTMPRRGTPGEDASNGRFLMA